MKTCCDWDTFELGFICHWHAEKPAVPSTLLIDWKKARRGWRRGNTGMEEAFMQLRALRESGEYLLAGAPFVRRRGGRDGGLAA